MAKKKHAVRMLDRDVSWMYFNRRILQEAQRDNVPLLERFTFLGIYSNNLDEFYRVRVSALKRVVEYEEEPHGGQTRHRAARIAVGRKVDESLSAGVRGDFRTA